MIDRLNLSDAKVRGARYFWPDVPCNQGHTAHRYVANGRCLECWFQSMHGRSHTPNDLVRGEAAADTERNRRAFVRTRKRRLGDIYAGSLGVGGTLAARKAATKRLWQNARNRARVRGIPFSVRASEFELPMMCPVLGIPLAFHGAPTGPDADTCAVLERVQLDRGYEVGNVTVVSARASRLRGDATNTELKMVSEFFRNPT